MRYLLVSLLLIPISSGEEKCNPFYVRWPRVRLNFKSVASARLSLRACESACSLGEDPQTPGRSLECAALNHHPSPDGFAHHCDIFQPHQLQNVDGYVEADDRYSFYWKYCLNTSRKCGGEHAFTYLSDRYMDARDVTRVTKKGSLEECLVECLDEKGTPCRSISFNRTDGGCHISADSQLTKPQAIHLNNNPNFRIDYYENNCYNLSDTFKFEEECRKDGILVKVKSKFPYSGALYGLYDFFTCRIEPKGENEFEYLFPSPTTSRNCSDSIRFQGDEMVLDVVLSTDGIEPLYFITPDDLTYQAKCPLIDTKYNGGNGIEEEHQATRTSESISQPSNNVVGNDDPAENSGKSEAKAKVFKQTYPLPAQTTTNKPTERTEASDSSYKQKSSRPVPKATSVPSTTSSTSPPTTTTSTTTARTSTTTTTTARPTTRRSTTTTASSTTTTSRPRTTAPTTTSTTQKPTTTAPNVAHIANRSPPVSTIGPPGSEKSTNNPTKPAKGAVSFDIFHNGQPVEAVVVGTKITLSFAPLYAIPPEHMSVRECQVEPIDSKYEWEREPLPIIREGCQADLVGLVCPPTQSEFGVKVAVESFRYQSTPHVQYSCLVRICPFAPCPTASCPPVEGCSTGKRVARGLSLEEIRRALEADPKLASQIGLPPHAFTSRPGNNVLVEQQLRALAGDHTVKRRLVVVNSDDQLRYYVRTGDIP